MAVDETDLDPELREDAIKDAYAKNKIWGDQLSTIKEPYSSSYQFRFYLK